MAHPTRFRPRRRLALVLAAACTLPVGMSAAVPVAAQTAAASPTPTVNSVRLLGEWKTEKGLFVIRYNGPAGYVGLLTPTDNPDDYTHSVMLSPTADGKGAEGRLYANKGTAQGTARIEYETSSGRIIVRLTDVTIDGWTNLIGTRGYNATWLERDFKHWFGAWQTTFGTITLKPEGAHIIGTMTREATDGHPGGATTVVLAPNPDNPSEIDGVWDIPAASSRQRGTLHWTAFDGILGGTYTSTYWDNPQRREWWVAERPRSTSTSSHHAKWEGQWIGNFDKTKLITLIHPDGENLSAVSYYHDGSKLYRGGASLPLTIYKPASGEATLSVGGSNLGTVSGKFTLASTNSYYSGAMCDWESVCREFTGSRLTPYREVASPAEPQPQPGPQPQPEPNPEPLPGPGPQPGGEPQPQPQPEPQAPSVYKALNRFDVRLDKVIEARGYPTRQVHAFVTLKNVATSQQYITSGIIRAVLTDTDGVAQERNQVWRTTVEPAALFNSTPVVAPGAELKIRYVFNPDNGSVPANLTLSEGGKTAEFPVSGF